MDLAVIEGEVTNLERTDNVSGGRTTAQIAIFSLAGERVVLATTNTVAMIANGDLVKVSGYREHGKFSAVACRNLTTGWVTPLSKIGCAYIIFGFMMIGGIVLSFLIPVLIILPLFTIWLIYITNRQSANKKRAHDLLFDKNETK